MGKLLLFVCVALLAVTFAMACTPPGALCMKDSDCCEPFICNPWAGRCTKPRPGPIAKALGLGPYED